MTKQNKYNARVQVNDVMLCKYFCIKDLCLHVKVIRRKNLQASNFVKEGKAKPGKATKNKKNSYKLSQKNNGKKREA